MRSIILSLYLKRKNNMAKKDVFYFTGACEKNLDQIISPIPPPCCVSSSSLFLPPVFFKNYFSFNIFKNVKANFFGILKI